jgi:hypothetical protein
MRNKGRNAHGGDRRRACATRPFAPTASTRSSSTVCKPDPAQLISQAVAIGVSAPCQSTL